MINQKFMKLCTFQDPNMKMCTLVGYASPLSFTPVMLLWSCNSSGSLKVYMLLDPHVPMLKGWVGPLSVPRIMSLKVVFQICFGSIKMMGTRGY